MVFVSPVTGGFAPPRHHYSKANLIEGSLTVTVVADDPLISGMDIRRMLPLHESSGRLRTLCPDGPRVHGVAVMADLSRRRWWPLIELVQTDRLQKMFDATQLETGSAVIAAQQLAATLAHVVVGRVVALLMLEGRAWDVGMENLWVHVDSEGAIDWVGVVDPLVRALSDDPCLTHRGARSTRRDGIVALPGEAALVTWVAHRAHRALEPLFARLHLVSGGAITLGAMWHIVGSTVVSVATALPTAVRNSGVRWPGGGSEDVAVDRAQAVLDAMVGFGAPVRGSLRVAAARPVLHRAC